MPTSQLKETWNDTWRSPRKRQRLIIGSVIMLVVVFIMPSFFGYIEKRQGVLMNDWLLAQIPPHNVSVLIFSIIWGMILFAVVRAVYNPSIYIIYCWSLIFVTIARFTCIALIPLDPPAGLIPLTDPITSLFYGHAVITKDLFFSGHTAVLTLIVLCLKRKTDKVIATLGTVIVGFLLLVQHIHYSVDVLAAPVITYAIYRATRYFLYKTKSKTIARRHAKVIKMPKKEILAKVYSEGK